MKCGKKNNVNLKSCQKDIFKKYFHDFFFPDCFFKPSPPGKRGFIDYLRWYLIYRPRQTQLGP